MTVSRPSVPADHPQTPPAPADETAAETLLTAPQVGRPGERRRFPSFRFLRDVRLPHALQNPLYRRYWWSQFVSLSGTWMQNVGSSLVVLSLTSSAIAIGGINVAAALPLLIINALSFVVVIWVLLTFRGLIVRRPTPPKQAGSSALKVGLGYVRSREERT